MRDRERRRDKDIQRERDREGKIHIKESIYEIQRQIMLPKDRDERGKRKMKKTF